MASTPEQTRAGYHAMWNAAEINPGKAGAAKAIAAKIIANRRRYEAIERKTGVPWFMIGPIHMRESSLSFSAHLHCGDPLNRRTVHVPKGRPVNGSPPFTFEESAIDALTMAPHQLDQVRNWSVERILFETEKYNGWGYLGKGNSPYLWSWTNLYKSGKYVADHTYSPGAVDPQPGCVAILKALQAADASVAARLNNRQPAPPPELVESAVRRATARDKRMAAGAATAGTAGAGTKAATEKPADPGGAQFTHAYVLPLAIAIAVAVALVFAIRAARKAAYIRKVW